MFILGVTVYKMNSPIQKIGVLFAVFNSVANPFVYALLMPAYRKSILKTFGCGRFLTKKAPKKEDTSSTSVSTLTSSAEKT